MSFLTAIQNVCCDFMFRRGFGDYIGEPKESIDSIQYIAHTYSALILIIVCHYSTLLCC